MTSRVVIALVKVQDSMNVDIVHVGPPHEVVDYLNGLSGRIDVIDKVTVMQRPWRDVPYWLAQPALL